MPPDKLSFVEISGPFKVKSVEFEVLVIPVPAFNPLVLKLGYAGLLLVIVMSVKLALIAIPFPATKPRRVFVVDVNNDVPVPPFETDDDDGVVHFNKPFPEDGKT